MFNHRKPGFSRKSITLKLTKMACIVSFMLFAGSAVFALPVISITNHTYSFGAQGSLNYTVTNEFLTCSGPPKSMFLVWSYSSFVFVDQFGTQHSLSGTADYIVSNPESAVCATTGSYPVTLNGGEYLITLTPSANGGATATIQLEQGYVDLRWVVTSVMYAAPGPQSFVQYTQGSVTGTTKTVTQSFTKSVAKSVSLSLGTGIPMVESGKITATIDATSTQTTRDSNSVTTTFQVQNTQKVNGTANAFLPVNHDYDVIWVWLNPVAIFTIVDGDAVWNGYGYDGTDQPSLDIVPVLLGYLNGDLPMPNDIAVSLARSWASKQKFPPGQTAAIPQAEWAQIAAADPFSVSKYGVDELGFTLPSGQTTDERFTISPCSKGSASISYTQPPLGQSPISTQCAVTSTTVDSSTSDNTSTYSQTFSLDDSVSVGFVTTLSADLKVANTLTWTTETQDTTSTTSSSGASATVVGPSCSPADPKNPLVGSCTPIYDPAGGPVEPVQFDVYQDALYATFMFAPVHYYCDTTVTTGCNQQ